MSAHRRRPALALLATAGLLLAACGDDDPAEPAAPDATVAPADDGDLPPLEELTDDNLEGLQAVYGPPLGELDLAVTRGGVVDFRGGTHLQLYVEPTTDEAANPPEVFLERMLTSFQAILPVLFDAYPELDSFDLCQEPVPGAATAASEYEEPVTLLLVSRAGYESVEDWSTATLEDLIAAAGEDLEGHVAVSPEIEALPEYPGPPTSD